MTDALPTHLDLDQLADALAGEPHGHLVGCASCTSRLAELRAAEDRVVAALQALPDPAVPGDLAGRLTAAFAAESPLEAPPDVRSNVTALPAQAPRRRFLPAAAAAVLLVSGGGLGYALVTGSADGGDTASTSDAAGTAAGGADLVQNASGTDYADAAAVTGALPAVLAGTAAALSMDSAAGASQAQPVQTASTELQEPAVAEMSADLLARLRDPAGLEDCLSAVLPPEEPDLRPLALDYATYQGQPALAVVLPDPDPAKLSVYVVGADCAAADARVLSFLRVDAP